MHFFRRLFHSYFGMTTIGRHARRFVARGSYLRRLRSRPSGAPVFKDASELRLAMKDEAYLNDPEIPLLARYAGKAPEAIAEIGCAFGASSIVFLTHCGDDVTVYSMDPFVVDSMAPFQATKGKCEGNVRAALRFVGKEQKFQQWNLIQDYSYNRGMSWTQPLDLLFIDGDHRYEAVKRDFDDWFSHVKKGGFILLHDSRKVPGSPPEAFDRGWAGPTRLVDELSSDPRVTFVESAFSVSVLQKL